LGNDKDKNSEGSSGRSSRRLSGQEPENIGLPPYPPLKKARTSEHFYGRAVGEDKTGKHAGVIKNEEDGFNAISPVPSKYSRRADRFGTPATDIKAFPKSVYTQSGTKLRKSKDVGSFAFYSERMDMAYDKERKDNDKKHDTEEIIKELVLTRESIEEAEKEIAQRKNNRGKSQNSLMGTSAKQHAYESKVSNNPNEAWEWLHLVGFRFLGTKGQDKENLVGGTNNANTDMLVCIEQHIKPLVREKGQVTLCVKASVQKGTKIADKIDYKISADNMKDINYSFDARTKNPTPSVVGKYTKKHIQKSLTDSSPSL